MAASHLIQTKGRQAGDQPAWQPHLEQCQLSKKQGLQMLEDLIGMITKHLKKRERVKIAGLGILPARKRAARMGRNPMTGEAIKINARKKSRSALPRIGRWRSDRRQILLFIFR